MANLRELAEKLSQERDPRKRKKLKQKIIVIQEKELRKKAAW